jgi:hypothetical protein
MHFQNSFISLVVSSGRLCVKSLWAILLAHALMQCSLFIQHGADPSIRNSEGKTPLELAESSTKAVLTGEYKKDELLEASR